MTKKQPPDLFPFLRGELLPAIKELFSYSETVGLSPRERHGLTTRIEAILFDLEDELQPGNPLLLFPTVQGQNQ